MRIFINATMRNLNNVKFYANIIHIFGKGDYLLNLQKYLRDGIGH